MIIFFHLLFFPFRCLNIEKKKKSKQRKRWSFPLLSFPFPSFTPIETQDKLEITQNSYTFNMPKCKILNLKSIKSK